MDLPSIVSRWSPRARARRTGPADGPHVPTALWVRAARRRPGRGAVVVLGLVAMAVATVASLVAGDSLERLFIADAEARWGEVDLVVIRPGEPLIGESTARFAGTQGAGAARAFAGRLSLQAVTTSEGGLRQPDVTLLGVSAEEQGMGPTPTGEGVTNPLLLGPDEVVVNRRLAERSSVEVGQQLDLTIAVPEHTDPEDDDVTYDPRVVPWRVVVAGIAADEGLADTGRTANVLARLDAVQRVADLPGLVSGLVVAAPEEGAESAEQVAEGFAVINRQLGLLAVEAKVDALELAEEEGGLFSGILLTLALLVVAASSVVTGNLIVLLGQERAREIAVLRAIGLPRSAVRRLLTAEAALYAVVAAGIGALLALPLAGVLAGAIAANFAGIEAGRGRELVELDLLARPGTVAVGVAVVVVVALLTAWSAGGRVAAIDVEEVLRGSAPRVPPPARGDRRAAVARGAGLVALGMALTASDAQDLLVFLAVALLGGALWLARRHAVPDGPDREGIDRRWAVGGIAFCLVAPAAIGDFAAGVQASFGILVLAGAGAVWCATVLATTRLPQAMRAVRVYLPGGRPQAVLRTSGSLAGELRSRSGTVVATIGVVVFMVAALAVLGSATDIGTARQRGGYDVVATSAVEVDLEQLRSTRGARRVDAMDHTVMGESWFATESDDDEDEESTVPYPLRAIRVEREFASTQAFAVADGLPVYSGEGGAERALLDAVAGAGVVVDRYARPEGAAPGDDVVIDDGRGPVSLPLLAVLDTYVLQGVLMGEGAYDDLFPRRGPTFVLAATDEGGDARALAGTLADVAADRGMVARTVAEAADEVVSVNRAFTDVFAIVLRVGLAVALVAVAVLVARAARERRAQLAVLRAVGLRRRDVAIVVLSEPVLLALLGIGIGLSVGLGVLYLLFARGFADLAFVIGWQDLAVTSAVVLALVVASSLWPAISAGRADPAAGLRDLG